jgi:hypothetical protein
MENAVSTPMLGGGVQRAGASVPQRRLLFFGVCVPVRLALAVLAGVLAARFTYTMPRVILALALAAAIVNLVLAYRRRGRTDLWWSNSAQGILALVVACGALLVLYKQLPPASLGILIAFSVIFGVSFAILQGKP